MSNSARTIRPPRRNKPSSATSGPGTNSSTRIRAASSPPRSTTSPRERIFRIRRAAAAAPAGSSARITPRLAARKVGFRTQGKPTLSACGAGSSSLPKTRNRGVGRPAAAVRSRSTGLYRAARAADGGFAGSSSASERIAARNAVSSSVGMTAVRGRCRENASTWRVASSGREKGRASTFPSSGVLTAWRRSVPTTTSTSRPAAAAKKSDA